MASEASGSEAIGKDLGRAPSEIRNIGETFRDYNARIVGVTGWRAWQALLLVPARLTASILGLGVVMAVVTAALPLAFDRLSGLLAHGETSSRAAVWSIAALGSLAVASAVLATAKERRELGLIVTITQLTSRTILRLLLRGPAHGASATIGDLSAQPSQIGQFAYVPDFIVSGLQSALLVAVVVWRFGTAGVASVVGLLIVFAVGVRFVGAIGQVWGKYIQLERDRVTLLTKVIGARERLQFSPFHGASVRALARARAGQADLLRRRTVLQTASNTLNRVAVVGVVTLGLFVGALLHTRTGEVLTLLLTARLLYAALDNNLVNYRVLRLTVPVLRRFDDLRAYPAVAPTDRDLIEAISGQVGIVVVHPDESDPGFTGRLPGIADSMEGATFIARDPVIPRDIFHAFLRHADVATRARLERSMKAFGLGATSARILVDGDFTELSNGERHRLALAVAVATEPSLIVSDDIVAPLDDATARTVLIALSAIGMTLVLCTRRDVAIEYATTVFAVTEDGVRLIDVPDRQRSTIPEPYAPDDVVASEVAAPTDPAASDDAAADGLPMPVPRPIDIFQAMVTIFGPVGCVAMVLGALTLVAANLGFALAIGNMVGSPRMAQVAVAASLLAIAVLASITLFGVQFGAPIARLTKLHERLVTKAVRVADRNNLGALVGRVGEDFSELQMETPGALATLVLGCTEALSVTALLLIGSPVLVIALVLIAPLAILIFRSGRHRLVSSAAATAQARAAMFDLAGLLDRNRTVVGSPVLRSHSAALLDARADAQLVASWARVKALAGRRMQVEGLTALVTLAALAYVWLTRNTHPLVAPATVLYFAFTVAATITGTIETVQESNVSAASTLRVISVLDAIDSDGLDFTNAASVRAAEAVTTAMTFPGRLIALVGPSGGGKTTALRHVIRHATNSGRQVAVADADIPVLSLLTADITTGDAGTDTVDTLSLAQRQQIVVATLLGSGADLIIFDESTNALDLDAERRVIDDVRRLASATGAHAVCVLHRPDNLHAFDEVIHV